MDDALEFVKELLRADRELSLAAYQDDGTLYHRLLDGLGDSLVHGVTLGYPRVEDPPPGWLEARRKIMPTTCQRELFQVRRHEHPEYGIIYRAYVSGNRVDERDEYEQCWIVGTRAQRLRLAGRYRVCWDCDGLARLGEGVSCRGCAGLGWEHRQGLDFSVWGPLTKTHKVRSPRPDAQRLEFDLGRS
jgi:hypothetical protein